MIDNEESRMIKDIKERNNSYKRNRNFLIPIEGSNKYLFTSESEISISPIAKWKEIKELKTVIYQNNINNIEKPTSKNTMDNLKFDANKIERKNIITKIFDKQNLTNYENNENNYNIRFDKSVCSLVKNQTETFNSHTIMNFNNLHSQIKPENINLMTQNYFNKKDNNNRKFKDENEFFSNDNKFQEYKSEKKQKNEISSPERNSEMHESFNCLIDGHELLIKNINEKNSKKENDNQFTINQDFEEDDEIEKNEYDNKVIEEIYLKTKTQNKKFKLKEEDLNHENIKKKQFKNLQNSYLRKNNKNFLLGAENSNENKSEAGFYPQLTCKNSIHKANETAKLSLVDPYVTYNTCDVATNATKSNKNKEYNFTNFFLSPKLKNEFDSDCKNSNFNNAYNKIDNSNETLKQKLISKIRFSYFSEFASLKQIDRLKIRNNYNNSLKPYQLELKKINNNREVALNKNKISAQKGQTKINQSTDLNLLTQYNHSSEFNYKADNKNSPLLKGNMNFDPLHTNNNINKNNFSPIYNYNDFKENKKRLGLPKITVTSSSIFPNNNAVIEEKNFMNSNNHREASTDNFNYKANVNYNYNATKNNLSNKFSINNFKNTTLLNKFVDNEYIINRVSEENSNEYRNIKTISDDKVMTKNVKNKLQNFDQNNLFFRRFMRNSGSTDANKDVFDSTKIKKINKSKH